MKKIILLTCLMIESTIIFYGYYYQTRIIMDNINPSKTHESPFSDELYEILICNNNIDYNVEDDSLYISLIYCENKDYINPYCIQIVRSIMPVIKYNYVDVYKNKEVFIDYDKSYRGTYLNDKSIVCVYNFTTVH